MRRVLTTCTALLALSVFMAGPAWAASVSSIYDMNRMLSDGSIAQTERNPPDRTFQWSDVWGRRDGAVLSVKPAGLGPWQCSRLYAVSSPSEGSDTRPDREDVADRSLLERPRRHCPCDRGLVPQIERRPEWPRSLSEKSLTMMPGCGTNNGCRSTHVGVVDEAFAVVAGCVGK